MRYVGFNEYFHDGGIAIIEDGEILFASSSERYSKLKYDPMLHKDLIRLTREDDKFFYYEDPGLRRKRIKVKQQNNKNNKLPIGSQKALDGIHTFPVTNFIDHHKSHAAGGFFTRPWESKEDTVIMTMDGVGEFESYTIYDHNFNKLDSWTVPKSLGLVYTRVTADLLGLRSMEDEYVTMGLSAYGDPVSGEEIYEWFNSLNDTTPIEKSDVYLGIFPKKAPEWYTKYKEMIEREIPGAKENIAASVQYLAEKVIMDQAKKARRYGSKLVWSGGVAQNIVAASKIRPIFDDMWIPVSPSDAGSALGVAAYYWCKDNNKDRINFEHAYLGHNIDKEINPKEVVDHLLEHRYCGIASGRAEFGPRALGNRSLIADVRYDVKDTVNEIKRRQKYRPFAPAILEEHADKYFEGPMNQYMQYQCKALHDYSSVTHVDGTARVQIVKKDCKSVFRKIIEEFYERTGVPMLLNTSLNIRGRPIVNDQSDAELFEKRYRVKVF